ncbi:unannotated protein [freshwater metagenome]|uniref:Unannotated protein n=1 Tax=freshwater metagenome TaxID=449393 RepID=A0A6J6UF73_9ZZZZ|nr:hypothetical protein [Actinomycetota bacterium]
MTRPEMPAPVAARLARSEDRWLRASADRLARRRVERLADRRDQAEGGAR